MLQPQGLTDVLQSCIGDCGSEYMKLNIIKRHTLGQHINKNLSKKAFIVSFFLDLINSRVFIFSEDFDWKTSLGDEACGVYVPLYIASYDRNFVIRTSGREG
jgi:hypothetical protein